MALEIWYNPRCSKSRATLEIIEQAGVECRVRRYLDDPPSVDEIAEAARRLEVEPKALIRLGDPVARDLDLAELELEADEWIELLAANPALIQRPLVLSSDGRAVLGRPPEAVHELLAQSTA